MILPTVFPLRIVLLIVLSPRYPKHRVSFKHSTVRPMHVLRNKFLSENLTSWRFPVLHT